MINDSNRLLNCISFIYCNTFFIFNERYATQGSDGVFDAKLPPLVSFCLIIKFFMLNSVSLFKSFKSFVCKEQKKFLKMELIFEILQCKQVAQ